jgi:aliphatic nitrilase
MLGASERDYGSCYMAQFVFGDKGDVLFTRRKLKPTHVERVLFGEGDGSDLHVQDVAGIGRLGATRLLLDKRPKRPVEMAGVDEGTHGAMSAAELQDDPASTITD